MDYSGAACISELHYLLSSSIMIRRLKKDVLHELPDKRRQMIEVAVDSKAISEINKVLAQMRE